MHQTSQQAHHYVVTAWTQQGIIQQTRTEAAGAVILALTLREAGHRVEVLDPMGNLLSPNRTADSKAR